MSIVVRFNPKNVTREKYDEVSRRLEQAGEWPHPPGLDFHVLYGGGRAARQRDLGLTREPRGLRADDLPDHERGRDRDGQRARDLRGPEHRQALTRSAWFAEHRRTAIAL